MRYRVSCLAVLIALAISAAAQDQTSMEWTSGSPVKMALSNTGIVGLDVNTQQAGTLWPRGTENQFVFGGGVWIGGWIQQTDGSVVRVMSTYDPSSGVSAGLPSSPIVRESVGGKERLTTTFSFRPNVDPIGLQATLMLETTSSGPLKDAAILHVRIRNTNATKTISQCVIGLVLDVEVGLYSAPIQAFQGDVISLISSKPELVIMKAHNAEYSSFGNNGVMSFASVGSDRPESFVSVRPFSITTIPITSDDRYLSMTTGEIKTSDVPSDQMVVASIAPRNLGPGEERSATFVLMFSALNDAASDTRSIEIVEGLRKATSVTEIVGDHQAPSIYPNPTNGAANLTVSYSGTPYKICLVDLMGQVVRTSTDTTEPFDIRGLPNGSYIMQLHGAESVRGLPLVITN